MGAITDGKGGTPTLKLMSWMQTVRYLRIWMTESSNTCDTHGAQDRRNCVGMPSTNCSRAPLGRRPVQGCRQAPAEPAADHHVAFSVDPWHAASDLDYGRGDQIGWTSSTIAE
jgi:hypothetical protein